MYDLTNENPTKDVGRYLKDWEKLKEKLQYAVVDKTVAKVFNDGYLCDEPSLTAKILVLNYTYSTNIFNVSNVIKHYVTVKNLGERLKQGDISLIKDLQWVKTKNGKQMNFYSFATKFCANHNEEAFPIYDRIAADMLTAFKNRDKFYTFTRADLKDYNKYVEIYKAFQSFYDLKQYSYREIDRYLWRRGKELNGSIK